jgi:2-C-methyl-D-erythritol 4-phosphate cytidylyltransferase/2-C-methyl-D-erythritol 2,4-cyclodiphosphate synthase
VLVVAAGRGTRAATGNQPKQYVEIAGRPVLSHTLDAVLASPQIDTGQVVIHADDLAFYSEALAHAHAAFKLRPPVLGGATRQASVRAGLEAMTADPPTFVLIHDAARPFVTPVLIDTLLEALRAKPAAILASPLTDTLKRAAHTQPLIIETLPRAHLWKAETPQGFRFEHILEAHRAAAREAATEFTDDASIAEWAGYPVALVDSGGSNTKITTPEDLALARLRLEPRPVTR